MAAKENIVYDDISVLYLVFSYSAFLLHVQFKLGHTVEYVKSFVESEYGIRMSEQVRSHNQTKLCYCLGIFLFIR